MRKNSLSIIKDRIMDAIGSIRDPERPNTLEELGIVCEERVFVEETPKGYSVKVIWTPTAPHCSFANNIGLSIVYQIQNDLSDLNIKLEVVLEKGSHLTEELSKI